MDATYDLIVIGTGVAGSSVASSAKKEGWNVAIVDEGPLGGTCPQYGCDPKKVMVEISRIYDDAKRVNGLGLNADISMNWEELIAFKNTFTQPIPDDTEKKFEQKGVDLYKGRASFLDANTLSVDKKTLHAKHFVIATGATPKTLPIEGSNHMVTSDQFFELKRLPQRLLFVGGGYIAFEFAHLAARLGKEVILVHRGKHVLEAFDYEMTNKLIETSKDLGIDIHTNTEVKKITKQDNGYNIMVQKFDHEHRLHADMVIHGGGRAANIETLALDNANVSYSDDGIDVNFNFQSTTQGHIYAAGDCASANLPALTPVAGEEAKRLISHLLHHQEQEPLQKHVPTIVYTYPMLASVGLTQQEAKAKSIPYECDSKSIKNFFTYKQTKETTAYMKILRNPYTKEILGAHFLSSKADHLINLFTLAIEHRITSESLKEVLWAYPTAESDIPSFF
ncbi:dihydrolipoyl dehydrogenase family protein [Thalassobacillus hwangdonensis]|uniref:Dihydrolipoyl dehydrogenase family protein n=1 Tax=Thalassobacillus hwangdonensis TaxID=546108 RepID=A0ABW3KWC3_9BACI